MKVRRIKRGLHILYHDYKEGVKSHNPRIDTSPHQSKEEFSGTQNSGVSSPERQAFPSTHL
jgi:hypothetical protein